MLTNSSFAIVTFCSFSSARDQGYDGMETQAQISLREANGKLKPLTAEP